MSLAVPPVFPAFPASALVPFDSARFQQFLSDLNAYLTAINTIVRVGGDLPPNDAPNGCIWYGVAGVLMLRGSDGNWRQVSAS